MDELVAGPSDGSEYFLRLDGIAGDSADPDHEGEIEVLTFSWGLAAPHDAASGRVTGRARLHPFQFTTLTSSASPQLLAAVAQGSRLRSGRLTARRRAAPASEYLRIDFVDPMVASYETVGDGGPPTDSAVLYFHRLDLTFWREQPDGSLGAPVSATVDWSGNR